MAHEGYMSMEDTQIHHNSAVSSPVLDIVDAVENYSFITDSEIYNNEVIYPEDFLHDLNTGVYEDTLHWTPEYISSILSL